MSSRKKSMHGGSMARMPALRCRGYKRRLQQLRAQLPRVWSMHAFPRNKRNQCSSRLSRGEMTNAISRCEGSRTKASAAQTARTSSQVNSGLRATSKQIISCHNSAHLWLFGKVAMPSQHKPSRTTSRPPRCTNLTSSLFTGKERTLTRSPWSMSTRE